MKTKRGVISLSEYSPDLCLEWDFERNYPLTPKDVSYGSKQKVWWKHISAEEEPHFWEAVIKNRSTLYNGCPYCAHKRASPLYNLKALFPEISSQWDYNKNKLSPEKYLPKANKKVWWFHYDKDGTRHEWQALISNRTGLGNNCPYCYGPKNINPSRYSQSLLDLYPVLCLEWCYEKNKYGPEHYTPGSGVKIWWQHVTPDGQKHIWENTVSNRTRLGNNCPYCSGNKVGYGNDLATNFPHLAKDWCYALNDKGPYEYTVNSGVSVWWEHMNKCGELHRWKTTINTRTRNNSQCPLCAPKATSKPANKWLNEQSKSLGRKIKHEQCIFISGVTYKVDGFDSDTNTIYEFLGDYWHSCPSRFNPGSVHPHLRRLHGEVYEETLQRLELFRSSGYSVAYIWESDFSAGKKETMLTPEEDYPIVSV